MCFVHRSSVTRKGFGTRYPYTLRPSLRLRRWIGVAVAVGVAVAYRLCPRGVLVGVRSWCWRMAVRVSVECWSEWPSLCRWGVGWSGRRRVGGVLVGGPSVCRLGCWSAWPSVCRLGFWSAGPACRRSVGASRWSGRLRVGWGESTSRSRSRGCYVGGARRREVGVWSAVRRGVSRRRVWCAWVSTSACESA